MSQTQVTDMNRADEKLWKEPLWFWGLSLLLALLLGILFYDGLHFMVSQWNHVEEYSYGYLIPLITAFLIWQRKNILNQLSYTGSYIGLGCVLLGLFIFFIGELATLYIVVQYAFLLVVSGLFLSLMGWEAFKKILVPLLILVFMIPLPNFVFNNISGQLQLISSQIGVWFIRLFDISVFLEGNVIDLGTMKLQVVEACSGLRYLFPLLTIAFILAYFYKGPFWHRLILVLSSIPITIFMNSFRIGVIGVTVEYWGKSAAEGFLHDFEGWVVFMSSFFILIVEAWILNRLNGKKQALLDVLSVEFPENLKDSQFIKQRNIPLTFIIASSVLLITFLLTFLMPEREENVQDRYRFQTFPLEVNAWRGRPDIIEQHYVDTLKFDDYLMADYYKDNQKRINFYIAYYQSQRKGASVHSPRSCLPGGGWEIQSVEQKIIDDVQIYGKQLVVNRVIMQLGEEKKLVYYWFQQRGRIMTNEYFVKWYLFWDALTKNRTDGALVRVITDIKLNDDLVDIEKDMVDFIRGAIPLSESYIPQ